MYTLDKYNEFVMEARKNFNKTRSMLAGVACPKCGEELKYFDDFFILTEPPKRKVICHNCGFEGFKIGG